MEHLTTHLHRPRTTRSPQNERGDGGIVPFEPFFSCFSRGSGESRNQKEEHEILFPFRRDQEIGSSRKKNAWYK